MELVVDANVLLAALLKEAITRELLLDSRLKLYAPEHLVSETLHHLKLSSNLRKRIQLSTKELEELFFLLTEEIQTISKKSYISKIKQALKLAPHKEDAPYLALALHLDISIWSNDKGIQAQDQIKVYNTQKIISLLMKR